jgi:hypothetical protein
MSTTPRSAEIGIQRRQVTPHRTPTLCPAAWNAVHLMRMLMLGQSFSIQFFHEPHF